MRSITLQLTRKCNYDCSFCGRHDNDSTEFLSLEEALAQAREGVAKGAETVMLSGGEPTLHPQFLELIAALEDLAPWRIVAQTNGGILAKERTALEARHAGLDGVELLVPSLCETVGARLTRVRTAAPIVRLAVASCLKAGLEVDTIFPVGSWRLESLAAECDELLADFPDIRAVEFRLVREDWLPSRGNDETAPSLQEAASAIALASRHVSARGAQMRLAPGDAIPFCHGQGLERRPELFELPPQAIASGQEENGLSPRQTPCGECSMAGYCGGIPDGHQQHNAPQPIDDEGQKAWTDVLEKLTAPQLGLFDLLSKAESSGKELSVYVLRLTPRCNIKCQHCWWTDWGRPDTPFEVAKRQATKALEAGVTEIAISGGEPSLFPWLPDLVAHIRDQCPETIIEVQTNALKCANPEYARRLAQGGLDTAFCTFLGSTKELYEEVTLAPGTWEKALAGIRNMQAEGIMVVLNYVVNSLNFKDAPEFVRWLHREFPHEGHPNPVYVNMCSAQPINPDLMEMKRLFLPYPEMAPYLRQAVDYCLEHGITVTGLNSISGVPHCVLDGDVRCFDPDERQHSEESEEIFTYIEACQSCELREVACQGIRRNYLQLFGEEGFRPISLAEARQHEGKGSLWRRVPQKLAAR